MGVLRLGAMCTVTDSTTLARRLDDVARAGLDCVQITVPLRRTKEEWDALLGMCAQRGMTVAAVGSYANLLEPDDARLHGATVTDVRRAMAALASARPLPTPQVVCWSGTYGATLLANDPRNQSAAARQAAITQAAALAEEAARMGCRLLIEPYHTHAFGAASTITASLRAALEAAQQPAFPGDSALGVVLDAPNLLTGNDLAELEPNLDRVIRALSPWATLVHLKDIATPPGPGEAPDLPPPGQGLIPYPHYLKILSDAVADQTPAILEHYDEEDPSTLPELVAFLRRCGWARA